MTCQSCKGTGQVVLLYSSVPCVDCELPAAPMAKCKPSTETTMWILGSNVKCGMFSGTVVGYGDEPYGNTLVRFEDGSVGLFPADYLEHNKDTI